MCAKENRDHAIQAGDLLKRGSRILGLASVAAAYGQRVEEGPWYVLAKETTDAAEEILSAFEDDPDPELLEQVVKAALSDEPATILAEWTEPIVKDQDIILEIGEAVDQETTSKVLLSKADADSPRLRGLGAIAIGFCRRPDNLDALTKSFNRKDRRMVKRMGALASVTVEPGEPSQMRSLIRSVLAKKKGINRD